MPDLTTSREKFQAEIPYSILEYTANFHSPMIQGWLAPGLLVDALLTVLGPSGFKLDGVEIHTKTEKISEYAMIFRRSRPGMVVTVGLGKCIITAENLDWNDAPDFIAAMTTALGMIKERGQAQFASQVLGLGMHIQIKNGSREAVTAPLVNEKTLHQLLDGEIKSQGIILQRAKATLLIDASVPFANALFVRFQREHTAEATLEEIAFALREDEEKLFAVLNLEGEL